MFEEHGFPVQARAQGCCCGAGACFTSFRIVGPPWMRFSTHFCNGFFVGGPRFGRLRWHEPERVQFVLLSSCRPLALLFGTLRTITSSPQRGQNKLGVVFHWTPQFPGSGFASDCIAHDIPLIESRNLDVGQQINSHGNTLMLLWFKLKPCSKLQEIVPQ